MFITATENTWDYLRVKMGKRNEERKGKKREPKVNRRQAGNEEITVWKLHHGRNRE